MSTTHGEIVLDSKKATTRFGYGVAIFVNLAMLVIVQNILAWGWLPFLTQDFAEVVPWITLSLVFSIAANLVYLANDTPRVKSAGQILTNLISIYVTYRLLVVFPFDFSSYAFNWAVVVRVVLILAMVGAAIAAVTETVKLVSGKNIDERR